MWKALKDIFAQLHRWVYIWIGFFYVRDARRRAMHCTAIADYWTSKNCLNTAAAWNAEAARHTQRAIRHLANTPG